MFVAINMAVSADGKITTQAREPVRFGSMHDRDHMDALRAEADAVVIGAQTLRDDNPHLLVRSEAIFAQRQKSGKKNQPCSVVVSHRGEIPTQRHFFTDAVPQCLVVLPENAPAASLARLPTHCTIWRLGAEKVDPVRLLQKFAEHGMQHILIEGGGELAFAFLAADVVDALYLTMTPYLFGGREAPTLVEGPGWRMADAQRLALCSVRQVGDEVFLHYRVLRRGVLRQEAQEGILETP